MQPHRSAQRDLYEQRKTQLATYNSAIALGAKEMSALQLHRIQVGRTGVARQRARCLQAARCPLRQLLAAVLLVYKGECLRTPMPANVPREFRREETW